MGVEVVPVEPECEMTCREYCRKSLEIFNEHKHEWQAAEVLNITDHFSSGRIKRVMCELIREMGLKDSVWFFFKRGHAYLRVIPKREPFEVELSPLLDVSEDCLYPTNKTDLSTACDYLLRAFSQSSRVEIAITPARFGFDCLELHKAMYKILRKPTYVSRFAVRKEKDQLILTKLERSNHGR